MRTKKNIFKMLLTVALLSVSIAHAQHETPVTHETVYKKSGTNNFTVVTRSDTVFKLLIKKFEPIILRYSVAYKTDRLGRYKEASIYFKLEDQTAILEYVKSI
ncbi:MAG TPA: hypothetical protein VH396_15165 [Chitinophagaceae bacterium]|jgi:hypothetical protein